MQRTMAWRFDGRLAVAVHGKSNPSNVEWQRFLNDTAQAGVNADWRIIVISYGGGPDGAQRQQMMATVRNAVAPMVMMSHSVLVRAVMSAFNIFNPKSKIVGLGDGEKAYDFLGLSSGQRETARRIRAELEAELGLFTTPAAENQARPRV